MPESVTVRGVAREAFGDGRVERDEARLAELALTNGEQAARQVDVTTLEPQCIGKAQAGGCEQREERSVSRGTQTAARLQAAARSEQSRNLAVAVDVR